MNEDGGAPTDVMTTVYDSFDRAVAERIAERIVLNAHWVGVDYSTDTFRSVALGEVSVPEYRAVQWAVHRAGSSWISIEALPESEVASEATSPDSFTMRFADLSAEAEAEMEAWQGVLGTRRPKRNDSGGGSVQREEEGSTPEGG